MKNRFPTDSTNECGLVLNECRVKNVSVPKRSQDLPRIPEMNVG